MPYRKAGIRPYRAEDEAVLFGLARMALGDTPAWRDERTLDVLSADTVFVAEIEGTPAGFVAIEPAQEAVRIDELFVAPEHEDEGLERQLVEYAEGFAIACRSRSLQVVVEGDDDAAVAFFRSYGFAPADAGVLELTLPQT
jgi:ribosomal protein S18 acetylase RimI-like enzyme